MNWNTPHNAQICNYDSYDNYAIIRGMTKQRFPLAFIHFTPLHISNTLYYAILCNFDQQISVLKRNGWSSVSTFTVTCFQRPFWAAVRRFVNPLATWENSEGAGGFISTFAYLRKVESRGFAKVTAPVIREEHSTFEINKIKMTFFLLSIAHLSKIVISKKNSLN